VHKLSSIALVLMCVVELSTAHAHYTLAVLVQIVPQLCCGVGNVCVSEATNAVSVLASMHLSAK
jgi:hypothetical protein